MTRPSRLLRAAAAACALAYALPAQALAVTDARGRQVDVADTSHVVSAGGTITEILYGLGLEDKVAAIDTSSIYPPGALAAKPNIGYVRALSAEGVLSLHPSLILLSADAGPPPVVDLLLASPVPVVVVDATATAEAVAPRIRFIGEVMGVSGKAEALAAKVEEDFRRLGEAAPAVGKRVLFVMSLQNGRLLVAGQKTAADSIIGLAGGVNAAQGFDGYKPMNDEAIAAAAPDAVLMMSRGGPPPAADEVFALPALAHTPAGADKRLIVMDGLALLGFGPRTPQAALDLRARLDATPAP